MDAIIQIQHVSKYFQGSDGNVEALQDISLDIGQGTIQGIIGMSGAGKSTLVRCMNRLERPTEGRVLIEGEDIAAMGDKKLRETRTRIGMIFQHFNLLMQRNVLGNVCFPLEITGMKGEDAVKRARELLELVGLSDKERTYPAQLSGGQKQRVAIARALTTNPKILLCDEATSALDPATTKSILALLKQINEKYGITIVIITHEMSVVREICTHVAVIEQGRLARQGKIGEGNVFPEEHNITEGQVQRYLEGLGREEVRRLVEPFLGRV